ncbi:MAG: cation diffusion facilitator family transporter [Bacteroidales bacterium]|nr:cation diffusion facilitator family transporter [Bacteroidales bacterium]
MSHSHSHLHGPIDADSRPLQRAYGIAIALNLAFVILEFILGRTSHSMGLVSDAGHKLLDVFMLFLALVGFRLARRPAADARRISAIIALINTAVLLFAVAMIVPESIAKFTEPVPVDGTVVSWTAAAGILFSGASAYLLMRHRGDINTRAAFLHQAADSLLSLGVVVAGIVINLTGWHIIDPIISLVIAAVILFNTLALLRDAIRSLIGK